MASSVPTKVSQVVHWHMEDGYTFDGWLSFEAYSAIISYMVEAYVDLKAPTVGGFQEYAL